MNISLKQLRDYYRRYLLALPYKHSKPCPKEDDIFRSFDPIYPKRLKFRLLHHIASCPNCTELFDICLTLNRAMCTLDKDIDQILEPNRSINPFINARHKSNKFAYATLAASLLLVACILAFTDLIPTKVTRQAHRSLVIPMIILDALLFFGD